VPKRKKEIRKIDDREDYEKSGFKSIMEDIEKTKKEALESVPKILEEQVPSNEEITKELVDGSEDIKRRAKKHTRK
jgi:hypothetical protein